MAIELFTANRATTTVSSGGTDAPSGGTVEMWTVVSSAMFGAAVAGVSQFHVADPAAPTEVIAVTAVSGTTWTVTRGAESTTPVTHSAGFTVYQVATKGFLASVLQATAGSVSVPLVMVPPPSGDTSGATDQAALQALENAADTKGATLVFAPGTYYVTGLTKQANTIWQGAGRFATIIQLVNGADVDVIQGANFSTLTLSGSTTGGIGGWGIRDLTIDGNKSNQSGTSHGLRVYGYEFDLTRVTIRNTLSPCLYTEWGNFGGSGTPDGTMEATYQSLKLHGGSSHGWHNRGPHDSRAWDVTIFNNSTTGYGYWGESEVPTTVASGSNGVNVSTFTGSGTLNVASTLGYPSASISSSQGALNVATSGTPAVITYTGVTATTFTGCTTVSGSGTLSTGGSVASQAQFSAAGVMLIGCHVWDSPLWDYVLDTQTHLTDCVGEVAQAGGGMILVRGGFCQVTGGLYVIYSGATQNGCGLQIGDTVNACTGLRFDSSLSGLSGADAAHSAINIVNDGGSGSVDALIYQPSGSAIAGTATASSRYRVAGYGGTNSVNAGLSLIMDGGTSQRFLPASTATAWRLTQGSNDVVNVNTLANRLEHIGGLLDLWYSGQYSSVTVEVDGATGHLNFPSTSAPAGTIVTAAIGTSGNGAAVSVTGNDTRGQIEITTASTGIGGSWPATVCNFTFNSTFENNPRMNITPANGASAALVPYGNAFSTTQFLLGFAVAPATSTSYFFNYIAMG